jgi:hypothetical protein
MGSLLNLTAGWGIGIVYDIKIMAQSITPGSRLSPVPPGLGFSLSHEISAQLESRMRHSLCGSEYDTRMGVQSMTLRSVLNLTAGWSTVNNTKILAQSMTPGWGLSLWCQDHGSVCETRIRIDSVIRSSSACSWVRSFHIKLNSSLIFHL